MKKTLNYKFFRFLIILLIALVSYNSLLTFFSLTVLIVSFNLVSRKNQPPIFPFIVIYHWIQISIKIFHANFLGVDINEIALSNSTDIATYLSLIGLLSLSLGIYVILRKISNIDLNQFKIYVQRVSLKKLFKLYIIVFIIFLFLKGVMFVIPSLTQIINSIIKIKLILIFFTFLISFIKKEYKTLVFIVITETIFGFSGFFSSFKEPYMLLFLSYFTFNNKINFKSVKFIIPLVSLVLIMGLSWTAIKTDYRKAINKDSNSMVVKVTLLEQINIFSNSLKFINMNSLSIAVDKVAKRLSYVDFFGQVIDYVPSKVKHQKGKLWFGAITHIFKPRILFPDKEIIDDSERTMKYTGHTYAGWEQGTSISLGYFAESYIDFGYFMFIPLFILGILFGLIFKIIINKNKNILLAYSIIVAVLLVLYAFETRNDKILGGVITSLIIITIMNRIFLTKIFISKYVIK